MSLHSASVVSLSVTVMSKLCVDLERFLRRFTLYVVVVLVSIFILSSVSIDFFRMVCRFLIVCASRPVGLARFMARIYAL